jgi:hypothetical protein
MKRIKILLIILSITVSLSNSIIFAQDNEKEISLTSIAHNTIISGQYFMAYNYDDIEDLQHHQYQDKRRFFRKVHPGHHI